MNSEQRLKYEVAVATTHARAHGMLRGRVCALCGAKGSTILIESRSFRQRRYSLDGHHEDYSKPFDMIYLCGQFTNNCHRKYHCMIRRLGKQEASAALKYLGESRVVGGKAAAGTSHHHRYEDWLARILKLSSLSALYIEGRVERLEA